MELLPLTSVIFSLLAGAPDMDETHIDINYDTTSKHLVQYVVEDVESEAKEEENYG